MSSGKVKSFYRQKKSGGISKTKPSPSISSKKKASPIFIEAVRSDVRDDQDKYEDMLRQFDLNMKYGPCAGMTRLERLERAIRLGINPPGDVESLLRIGKVGAECVFEGRI